MRKIDSVIIHCSATKAGMDFSVADIDRWHRARGMNGIGYHYVVRLDGTVEKGREVEVAGAHCLGWNGRSIGICYIGGLDTNGNPADTRTDEQKKSMKGLVEELKLRYRIVTVMGHRDTSPDLNGNGIIEPGEFIKSCPCFDVKKWLMVWGFSLFFWACGTTECMENHRTEIDAAVLETGTEKFSGVQKRLRKMQERMNEHVEETIFVWTEDTAEMVGLKERVSPRKKLLSVTKRTVDRDGKRLQEEKFDGAVMKTDSLQVAEYVRMKTEDRVDKQEKKRGGWGKLGLLAGICVEGSDAVEPAGIRLGGAVALPLHRVDMEQHRTAEIFSLPQHPGQLDPVVAVHRPHIRKAHVFKQGAAGKQGLFQRRFHVVADGIEPLSRLGGLQHLAIALFKGVVAGLAAQA